MLSLGLPTPRVSKSVSRVVRFGCSSFCFRRSSILADSFEAVLGAIYLDGGIRPARAFVKRHLGAVLKAVRHAERSSDDFKTQLQELCQAELQLTPRYRIVSTAGPAHELEFVAEVLVGRRVRGRFNGSGHAGHFVPQPF